MTVPELCVPSQSVTDHGDGRCQDVGVCHSASLPGPQRGPQPRAAGKLVLYTIQLALSQRHLHKSCQQEQIERENGDGKVKEFLGKCFVKFY